MTIPQYPPRLIESMELRPGEIEIDGYFIGVAGGINGHTDSHFPMYSAFLTIRNDDCRVWQRGGYSGTPKPGDRFVLCIHRQHGVQAKRGGDEPQFIVLLHADGATQEEAEAKLAAIEAELMPQLEAA